MGGENFCLRAVKGFSFRRDERIMFRISRSGKVVFCGKLGRERFRWDGSQVAAGHGYGSWGELWVKA